MTRGRWFVSLLLAISLFGACDSGGGSRVTSKEDPEPAATTLRPEPVSNLQDSPFGKVLAWSAPNPNVVWAVTTATKSCMFCAALWKKQGDAAWRRVHTFAEVKEGQDDGYGYTPVDVDSLAMSADGKHGLFQWETTGLMRTTDGGRTWAYLPAPKGDRNAKAFGLGVHRGWFVFVDGRGRVWRTDVDQAVWEEITPEGVGRGVSDLRATEAGLGLTVVTPRGESARLSSDAGDSWQEAAGSRTPQRCMLEVATVEVLVATCERYDKASWIEVSTDGALTWKKGPDLKDDVLLGGTYPVGSSGSVVVEQGMRRLVLIRADGSTKLLPMRAGNREGPLGPLGSTTVFYSDDANLFRSRDEGETWEKITP